MGGGGEERERERLGERETAHLYREFETDGNWETAMSDPRDEGITRRLRFPPWPSGVITRRIFWLVLTYSIGKYPMVCWFLALGNSFTHYLIWEEERNRKKIDYDHTHLSDDVAS